MKRRTRRPISGLKAETILEDSPISASTPYSSTATSKIPAKTRGSLLREDVNNIALKRLSVSSRRRILLALTLYAVFYGGFIINIVDLNLLPTKGWFHIFLAIMYFCPSILLLIIFGRRGWRLALVLGLLISLMNDLFYAPVGNLLAVSNYDLARWYARQFGLLGLEPAWIFQAGIIAFRTTSILIGASIYVRLIAVCVLILEWWRKRS